MSLVKGDFPPDRVHASLLMGLLFHQVREEFAREDWHGLRQSHFRVLSCVPDEGVSITSLGERVGMTKQGCGQFVTQLAESGHLRVVARPNDRRVRVVRRTAKADRVLAAVRDRNLAIEHEWAERVGPDRYAVFRDVLGELAVGSLPD
jgi:DNA-binding MarR family transcriptional regulator